MKVSPEKASNLPHDLRDSNPSARWVSCMYMATTHAIYQRSYQSLGAILILSLSACASQPIPVPEIIHEKTYVPVPATLTQPISVDLSGMTWGQGIGALNAAVETCNGRLASIHTLTNPPPK